MNGKTLVTLVVGICAGVIMTLGAQGAAQIEGLDEFYDNISYSQKQLNRLAVEQQYSYNTSRARYEPNRSVPEVMEVTAISYENYAYADAYGFEAILRPCKIHEGGVLQVYDFTPNGSAALLVYWTPNAPGRGDCKTNDVFGLTTARLESLPILNRT